MELSKNSQKSSRDGILPPSSVWYDSLPVITLWCGWWRISCDILCLSGSFGRPSMSKSLSLQGPLTGLRWASKMDHRGPP